MLRKQIINPRHNSGAKREKMRVLDNHTDYNRETQRKVGNIKHYGGVSMYIAQRQAKREVISKFRSVYSQMSEKNPTLAKEIESKIEFKCMNVKDIRTLERWLDNDWEGLKKAFGIVSLITKIQ